MDGKQKLLTVTKSMAHMNHVIDVLESIGLTVDDNTFDGSLYKSFNGLCDIAMENLTIESVSEENTVFNHLIEAKLDSYEQTVEEIWEQYGNK